MSAVEATTFSGHYFNLGISFWEFYSYTIRGSQHLELYGKLICTLSIVKNRSYLMYICTADIVHLVSSNNVLD